MKPAVKSKSRRIEGCTKPRRKKVPKSHDMQKIKTCVFTRENWSFFERILGFVEMTEREEIEVSIECEDQAETRIWLATLTLARKLKLENITQIKIYCKNYKLESAVIEFYIDSEITYLK